MKKTTRRHILKWAFVTALASGPFMMHFLRKPKHLQESVIKRKVPFEMSSSGYLSMADASFIPLTLPNSNDIQIGSITAGVSTDKNLILVAYSYGDDWKSQLCCASLSKKNIVGNFETLLDIKKSQSIITEIGCSGIKNNWLSFVLRQCEPEDKDDAQTNCRESLCIAHLSNSPHGRFSLPEEDVGVICQDPHQFLVLKKAFIFFTGYYPHCWADGTDSLFFGGWWGVERFRPREKEPSALYARKVVSNFGESENLPNQNTMNPQNVICSNIYDNGNKTLSFVIAPRHFVESPYSEKEIEYYKKRENLGKSGFFTGEGKKFVMDVEGNILSQIPFPALPFFRKALLTQTHWCFAHITSGQFIISAPLDEPKNFTMFSFPENQIVTSSGINLTYEIHAVLPDGQSLLCSRNVGNNFIEKAKAEGFPLCEFGIVKLPLSIG